MLVSDTRKHSKTTWINKGVHEVSTILNQSHQVKWSTKDEEFKKAHCAVSDSYRAYFGYFLSISRTCADGKKVRLGLLILVLY